MDLWRIVIEICYSDSDCCRCTCSLRVCSNYSESIRSNDLSIQSSCVQDYEGIIKTAKSKDIIDWPTVSGGQILANY